METECVGEGATFIGNINGAETDTFFLSGVGAVGVVGVVGVGGEFLAVRLL